MIPGEIGEPKTHTYTRCIHSIVRTISPMCSPRTMNLICKKMLEVELINLICFLIGILLQGMSSPVSTQVRREKTVSHKNPKFPL